MKERIAVIGAGIIGGSIVESLLKSGYDGRIAATRREIEKLEKLGALIFRENKKAVKESDIVFICVKPNDVEMVLKEISREIKGKLVISVAATIPLEFYEKLAPKGKFIRAMPNIAVFSRIIHSLLLQRKRDCKGERKG